MGAAIVRCEPLGWRIRVALTRGAGGYAQAEEKAEPIIRKGDQVQLTALAGSFSVSTIAIAEQDGAPGDRIRLRQVLANLLDNAVKYTPPGGRIEIGSYEHGSDVRIVVEDTGRGIPAEEMPRIWERLYRGDMSRSERGLGLGLSLVKAIVEAHNGSIDVTSRDGQGTRMTIQLPRRSASRG